MELNEYLEDIAVVGAAGKMGSGIALLLALELARRTLSDPATSRRLTLIDPRADAHEGLASYINSQAEKTARLELSQLRELLPKASTAISDDALVERFVAAVRDVSRPATDLTAAASSQLVFEAILEDEGIKVETLRALRKICGPETFFLTNTSSIPIRTLEAAAELDGRIIGYHFYNPPAVQQLVEVIPTSTTRPQLVAIADHLGKCLGKKLIDSGDVAGFIGNGYFIREGLYALELARRLTDEWGEAPARLAVDRIGRDWLLRPMGIFQVIDYVGLDVFACILGVMDRHLAAESFADATIEAFLTAGVRGGQHADGTQRDGFFQYDGRSPVGVFALGEKCYAPLADPAIGPAVDANLGPAPAGVSAWSRLRKDPDREGKISKLLAHLETGDGCQETGQGTDLGAALALAYLERSRTIAQALVDDGVAANADAVNGVLTKGFYHLYGPLAV